MSGRHLACAAVIYSGIILSGNTGEFTNSFAIDLGPKRYRCETIGQNNRFEQHGSFSTNIHASWMLRFWDTGFESPGFIGGLGLAYGFYEDNDINYQIFEWRADMGPAFDPTPWMRVAILAFGGIGYHDINLPPNSYALTGIGGAGMWGFSYGAHAMLTLKPWDNFHLSLQGGFRGLYASFAIIENNIINRSATISATGFLAGGSLDFVF